MTSKEIVRLEDDIDEKALPYEEIKELSVEKTPIIKKTELDTQVAKLKLLKQISMKNSDYNKKI